jgi:hypothetical protein
MCPVVQVSLVQSLRDVQVVAAGALNLATQVELDIFVCALAQMTAACCTLFQQQPGACAARCAAQVHIVAMDALAAMAHSAPRRTVLLSDQAVTLLRSLRPSYCWQAHTRSTLAEVSTSAEQIVQASSRDTNAGSASLETTARQVQAMLQVRCEYSPPWRQSTGLRLCTLVSQPVLVPHDAALTDSAMPVSCD